VLEHQKVIDFLIAGSTFMAKAVEARALAT
jgi:hypothetical protein